MVSRGRGRPSAGTRPVLTDDDLLTRALEMFAERGFEGTSIRELARALHVSHNLIPQRYGSKERLWYVAVDRGFGELIARIEDAAGPDPDIADPDAFRRVIIAFLEASASSPTLQRILMQEAVAPGPRLEHLFDSYLRPVADRARSRLGALHRDGRARTDDAALLFFITQGAAAAMTLPFLAHLLGDGADASDPERLHRHAVAAVDVMFDGILWPEPRRGS